MGRSSQTSIGPAPPPRVFISLMALAVFATAAVALILTTCRLGEDDTFTQAASFLLFLVLPIAVPAGLGYLWPAVGWRWGLWLGIPYAAVYVLVARWLALPRGTYPPHHDALGALLWAAWLCLWAWLGAARSRNPEAE